MKSLYVTSVDNYSGKTAVCLGLGKRFQSDGYRVGYLKPISLQPWLIEGHMADGDAVFVKDNLGLDAEAWDLCPIVITPEFLQNHLHTGSQASMVEKVKSAAAAAASGQDVLLLEGGATLREGHLIGLPPPDIARLLESHALVIIKYDSDVQLLDDILNVSIRFGERLAGVLINRVPAQAAPFVNQSAVPYLEKQGITILGALPDSRSLTHLTVEDLVHALNANVLTHYYRPQAVIESLTVGAMTAETALSRMRRQSHKAVITGGDRTDIQLAALETSTTCMVLTGNLHPSPLVVKTAEEFGVAVLLVRENTMEAVGRIEKIYGKTRLRQTAKLRQFMTLMEKNLDFERLYRQVGLKP
jgi:BioD-like phosphotransacetylase family protein